MKKKNDHIIKSEMRIEEYVQFSGDVKIENIPIVKERNYFVQPIPLDGDAPKQYIKAYHYYKNCPKRLRPKTWHGYFAKFGRKSYPHESITEYIINKLGENLGLSINDTRLVIIKSQVRFLSKNFLKKNEKLIHGIEVLGEYFEDVEFAKELDEDKKERRKYLTFELIEKAFKHVYPGQAHHLLKELVKLIVFDAIVGNNDRHYYNWGLIGNIEKNTKSLQFAPIYDTARGLLWNITDKKLNKMLQNFEEQGNDQLQAFIKRSRPRISFLGNSKANHFELVGHLYHKAEYREVIESLVNSRIRQEVLNTIEEYANLYFSEERKKMLIILMSMRFEVLLNKTI
ncbi:MAG: HipA domain-containing protein [Leeuwenhoekiella sp.]